jgi:hypothetical protein
MMADSTQLNASQPLNPAALTVEELAVLLTRGGGGGKPVTTEMIREDLEAGAPTTADGRINLVHYTAWLARELSGDGGGT